MTVHVRADPAGAVLEASPRGEMLRLDAGGRWTHFARAGALLRRTLMGDVYAGRGPAVRLSSNSADLAHRSVVRAAARWSRQLSESGRPLCVGKAPCSLGRLLARAATFGPPAAAELAAQARRTYPHGVPILPPHRYRDLVLTPAHGCPNATCSFCIFHRGQRFVALGASEFDDHLHHAQALHGEAWPHREGVFLGSASAASLPDAYLLHCLERVRDVAGPRRRGVAAFLDPDHAPRRNQDSWRRLHQAGLVDITVGLETGLADLRAAVGKSDDVARFVKSVHAMKAAGLRVAVCVLVGLGGLARAQEHLEATLRALRAMNLDAGDLVYLSALQGAMGAKDPEGQRLLWRRGLAGATCARASVYPAADFILWA